MTRKDYIVIARGLNATYQSACDALQSPEVLEAILRAAYGVASELKAHNSRFDCQHFMAVVRGVKALTSRPSSEVR